MRNATQRPCCACCDRCECRAVEPWAAIVIGIIGGFVYYGGVALLDKIQIDDVVLAIPVHCFCGICAPDNIPPSHSSSPGCFDRAVLVAAGGVLSVGFFASPQSMGVAYGSGGCGIFYAGHANCLHAGDQLVAQLLFVVAIFAWVTGTMFIVLLGTKFVLGIVRIAVLPCLCARVCLNLPVVPAPALLGMLHSLRCDETGCTVALWTCVSCLLPWCFLAEHPQGLTRSMRTEPRGV